MGAITFDYLTLTISFIHQGHRIVLSDEVPTAYSICSTHLRQDISNNEIYELFLLCVSPEGDDNLSPYTQPSEVDGILFKFPSSSMTHPDFPHCNSLTTALSSSPVMDLSMLGHTATPTSRKEKSLK